LVVEKGMNAATMNFNCGLFVLVDMVLLFMSCAQEFFFSMPGGTLVHLQYWRVAPLVQTQSHWSPSLATFGRLMKNIRFNDLTGYINVSCFAVGASHGSVQFTANSDAHNRVVSLILTPSQEPTVYVHLTSLDQLLQEAGATSLVWKVDVECYEPEVLLDAAAALSIPTKAPWCWKPTTLPCSSPWNRPASLATATTSSVARSAPRVAPVPSAATISSGSVTFPSCSSAAARRRRCG
jgi:FkbM family methyltransferase